MQKKRLSIAVLSGLTVETLNRLAPLIVMYVAQKRLGMQGFGYALFGVSVIEIIIPFITFGYNHYGMIKLGELQDNQREARTLISNIFYLRFLHFVLSSIFLLTFFYLTPHYRPYLP